MSPRRVIAALRLHSFETAMSTNAVAVAAAGLVGWTHGSATLRAFLPSSLATAMDVAYLVGGGMILWGLLREHPPIELAGLILVATSAIVRVATGVIAIAVTGNMIPYLAGVLFHTFLVLGAGGRAHSTLRGERTVVVSNGGLR